MEEYKALRGITYQISDTDKYETAFLKYSFVKDLVNDKEKRERLLKMKSFKFVESDVTQTLSVCSNAKCDNLFYQQKFYITQCQICHDKESRKNYKKK